LDKETATFGREALIKRVPKTKRTNKNPSFIGDFFLRKKGNWEKKM